MNISSSNCPNFLYKIVTIENWKASQGKPNVVLDTSDSKFIHFSTRGQVERIVDKYFKDKSYVLLEVDPVKCPGQMKFETNPGGDTKYFHLYNGEIPKTSIKIIASVEVLLKTEA